VAFANLRREQSSTPSIPRSRAILTRVHRFAGDALKRLIDIVAATVLLILLFPVVLLIALLIKLETPGPAFYGARRVGHRGREFKMLKFRKMGADAEGPPLTTAGDDRFTGLGHLLAESKLDEVPQLINVLRGQMSLIGPRPEDPHFVSYAPEAYDTILTVKPGVTGLSQLAFAREGEIPVTGDRIEHYLNRLFPQKAAMDMLYARRRSTMMDLRILCWTVYAVLFKGSVSVHRSTARLSRRAPRTAPAPAPAPAPALERARPATRG
jgi:lipopolysaccharide/colanic/teichoic acid biosynthesis glycosyltransferase